MNGQKGYQDANKRPLSTLNLKEFNRIHLRMIRS